MFEYYPYEPATIANFKKACERIEKAFPDATKQGPYTDVDGVLVISYNTAWGEITIINDSDFLNEVYIHSEMKLENIF